MLVSSRQAMLVNKLVRGALGRIRYRKRRARLFGAATKIQATFRAYRAVERYKLRKILFVKWKAVDLQRVLRGHLGRQRARARRFLLLATELYHDAPESLCTVGLFF